MITSRALSLLVTLAAAPFALGCEENQAARGYGIKVLVTGDPGKPVAGALVQNAGKTLGTSDLGGVVMLELHGQEGDSLDLGLRCPQGFESPKRGISVRLSRPGDAQKTPEYVASCAPSIRHVVVAVRADNGANMPITYLGRPITTTDASGSAHVLMRMRPGESFELGLDTSAFPKHRPQNPKASFLTPSSSDEVLRFDVRFDVERPKPVARAAPPKRPTRL